MAVALEDLPHTLEHPEYPEPPRIRTPRLNSRQAFGMSVRLFRQNNRLSLEDISQATAINLILLEALENGENTKDLTVRDVKKIAETSNSIIKINNLKPDRYGEGSLWSDILAQGARPRLKAAHPKKH